MNILEEFVTTNAHYQALRRKLAKLPTRATPKEGLVLYALRNGSLTNSEVADLTNLFLPHITATADSLKKKRLITEHRAADARVRVLELTDEGKKELKVMGGNSV